MSRFSITLLCLVVFTLHPGLAGAQSAADLTLAQSASMPGWTVPVLRLVSATHVEPTTGVVLSDSGMVLVPADFAGPGDEIIVLDGGTDIIRNGRPAKIVQRFSSEGLEVLSVPALQRSGASFSSGPLIDGSRVRLHAFPPAELIAEGKPPLDIEAAISAPVENGKPSISGETRLPNVSGALVDECGNLAGYSSANGVQSMSTSEFPRYQFKDTLIRLAGELQLTVKIAECNPVSAESDEPSTEAEPEAAMEESPPQPEEQAPENSTKPDVPDVAEPEVTDPAEESGQEEIGETLQQGEETDLLEEIAILPPLEAPIDLNTPGDKPDAAENSGLPAWLWLVVAVILLGGGFLVHRLRKGSNLSNDEIQSIRPQPEPLSADADEEAPLSPGLDSELIIVGEMTDGARFEARCPVSSQAINLVIGRGQADIAIESPVISRRHATMNGTADQLTLSDLGSSNGTSINGVPCLEGETLYVRPGDTIIVGNARFRFTIEPARREQAAE